jgi:hypothetical protein
MKNCDEILKETFGDVFSDGRRCISGSVTQFLREFVNPEDGMRYYQCGLCSKTAATKYNLKRHLILKHARPTQEACEYCGKIFRNKFYKENHIRQRTCLKDALFDPV